MPRVVTLTTDFGSGSDYVAQLKGRLLHAREPFTLVDIAHDVPAHDMRAAAWLVTQACFEFPVDTLHLIVVDPGVGTSRRLVWARIGGQQFLAPDNGVLGWAMRCQPLAEARQIAVPGAASATFHGRDVIAPCAVRLLDGAGPAACGPPATELTPLPWEQPHDTGTALRGAVIHVDTFGTLVTNLPAALLPRLMQARRLRVGEHDVTTIVRTYGDAAPGTVVALAGSHGFLEVAVVGGRADGRLGAGIDTPVELP